MAELENYAARLHCMQDVGNGCIYNEHKKEHKTCQRLFLEYLLDEMQSNVQIAVSTLRATSFYACKQQNTDPSYFLCKN